MRDFEELLHQHISSAETYVKYKVSSKEDAEDILQETYVRAFRSFNSLKSEESFKPWLISIARNKVNDYYRKKAEILEIPYDDEVIHEVSLNRTVRSSVSDTLEKLDDNDRKILYLYYWHDLPQKDIAEKLGIPVGTVKSRIFKARKRFEEEYPKEEIKMKKLPEKIFEYTITEKNEKPFEVKWEELMGWFLIPREGNKIRWGIYDFPEKTLTEEVEMKCHGEAEIHGIRGVKIDAVEKQGRQKTERKFVAQLTDSHCRYLAEAHYADGVEKLFTFLDGDAFLNNWGFGPDNIGNETNLVCKGTIVRKGNVIEYNDKDRLMDIVGRYEVTINGKTYDTVCLMDLGTYDENAMTEQYIDRNGRTVLWRRFNKANWRWNYNHFEEILDEKLKDNESIIFNGTVCYHWYDCITDYIL